MRPIAHSLRLCEFSLLLFALALLQGCGKLDAAKDKGEDPYANIPTLSPGEVPRLPMGVEGSGGDVCYPIPITGCRWALSHDSVIYGKLVDMRLLDQPLFRQNPVTFELEEVEPAVCDRIISIFEIDIAVERWAGVEPPALVTIRMGPAQYLESWPFPSRDPAGELYWERVDSPKAGKALELGQMLGAGVHYYPEIDRWGLAQDTLFAPMLDIDGREIVAFPTSSPNACEGPPVEWNGLSVDELFASIAACPEDPMAKVRYANIHSNGEWLLSAICSIDPIPYTPCKTDGDCKVPEEGCSFYHQVCVAAADVMSEDLYVIDPLNP